MPFGESSRNWYCPGAISGTLPRLLQLANGTDKSVVANTLKVLPGTLVNENRKVPPDNTARSVRTIGLTAGVQVSLPDDPDTFAPTYKHSFYPDSLFHVLGPRPADAIREIERLVDVGVSHFQVAFDDMTSLRRFMEDVVPAARMGRAR